MTLAVGALAGCATKAPPAPPPPVIVGLWIADNIAGTPVPPDARLTLSLYGDGKVVGRAGCNNYSGTYRRAGDTIAFTPFIATQMACDPAAMTREQAYLGTLAAATHYQRTNDGVLVIATDSGTDVRFRREETAALRDARSRGIAFRGIGQEPGWVVEVKVGGEISALLDYGATNLVLPTPEPIQAEGIVTYEATTDTDHLILKIRDKTCIDAMSGEPHPQTVDLTINDKAYAGCGDWLD